MVGDEVKRRPRHTGVRSGSEPVFSRLFKQNRGCSLPSLFSNTTQRSNNRKVVEARLSFICTRYAGAQEGGTTVVVDEYVLLIFKQSDKLPFCFPVFTTSWHKTHH